MIPIFDQSGTHNDILKLGFCCVTGEAKGKTCRISYLKIEQDTFELSTAHKWPDKIVLDVKLVVSCEDHK